MQLNEALFVSSPGYVLKPREMLESQLEQTYATQEKTSTVLSCDVAGLSSRLCFLVSPTRLLTQSSVPFPDNLRNMKLYVRAELIHSGGDKEWYTEKKDCVPTEERFADVLFNQSFEFKFDTEELVFVRYVSLPNVVCGKLTRRQFDRQSLSGYLEGREVDMHPFTARIGLTDD
jgi:phosphatidylinositol phospholipase C delta